VGGVALAVVTPGAKAKKKPKVFDAFTQLLSFVLLSQQVFGYFFFQSLLRNHCPYEIPCALNSKVFTIRFIPKRGLTLVWSKKDSLVLNCISEVSTGGGPRASLTTGALPFSSSFFSVGGTAGSGMGGGDKEQERYFTLRYNENDNRTPPRNSLLGGGGSPRSSSSGNSSPRDDSRDASLVLEADSPQQRDHLARCFRRLAQQERERSSFLLEM